MYTHLQDMSSFTFNALYLFTFTIRNIHSAFSAHHLCALLGRPGSRSLISSHGTSTLFLFFRFLSIVFRFSISPCLFIIQINSVSFFRLRNNSSFVFILFIHCFYCLVQLLLPLVFQLPQSLRFSRRGRHTSLVNFVVFPSFACFICISFWFPALYIQLLTTTTTTTSFYYQDKKKKVHFTI